MTTKKTVRKKPLVLLTNDDGFFSKGIEELAKNLDSLADIHIVAPAQEKSATSLALTLHHPLRVKTIRKNVYAVSGTPADCVYMALQKLLPKKPALIISGINAGPNLGQQDISHSGTVAGAFQGTFLQIPSIAVSMARGKSKTFDFSYGARITRRVAEMILSKGLPEGITLNINIPPPPFKGIRIVKLGEKRYNPEIYVKKDPRDRIYYWIGTGQPKAIGDSESDVMVIKRGYITVTPLHKDMTAFPCLQEDKIQHIIKAVKNENI